MQYPHLSQEIIGYRIQELEQRKAELEQLIAQKAELLETIETELQTNRENKEVIQPATILFVSSNRYTEDDIYTWGTRARRPPIGILVTSNDIGLMYLGIRAKLPEDILSGANTISLNSQPTIGRTKQDESFNISFISAMQNNREINVPPTFEQELQRVAEATVPLIQTMLDDIVANNPYRNIPIKINEQQLHEVQLRQAMLDYCHANDESYSISIVAV